MAKGQGLSNDLLGKVVLPQKSNSRFTDDPPYIWWPKHFVADAREQHHAIIMAAWVQDGKVMVLLKDPAGHCEEAYLSHCILKV